MLFILFCVFFLPFLPTDGLRCVQELTIVECYVEVEWCFSMFGALKNTTVSGCYVEAETNLLSGKSLLCGNGRNENGCSTNETCAICCCKGDECNKNLNPELKWRQNINFTDNQQQETSDDDTNQHQDEPIDKSVDDLKGSVIISAIVSLMIIFGFIYGVVFFNQSDSYWDMSEKEEKRLKYMKERMKRNKNLEKTIGKLEEEKASVKSLEEKNGQKLDDDELALEPEDTT